LTAQLIRADNNPAVSDTARFYSAAFVRLRKSLSLIFLMGKFLNHPPIPKDAIPISLSVQYTARELAALREPFRDLEQWFLYFVDPWLLVYKGELCYFWLKIPESSQPARIDEGYVNSSYPRARSVGLEKSVEDQLDNWCGLLRLREEAVEAVQVGGIRIWIMRNQVAIDSSAHRVDDLLTQNQARLLGETLISFANSISKYDADENR